MISTVDITDDIQKCKNDLYRFERTRNVVYLDLLTRRVQLLKTISCAADMLNEVLDHPIAVEVVNDEE